MNTYEQIRRRIVYHVKAESLDDATKDFARLGPCLAPVVCVDAPASVVTPPEPLPEPVESDEIEPWENPAPSDETPTL